MRFADPLRFGAVILLVSGVFASCNDTTDDSLVNACKIVVDTCHHGTSVGDCLDDLGGLSQDCIDCISAYQCDYPTCQVSVYGCRIPTWLLNPNERIDAGTRSPDGGASTADAGDSGSRG